jgi:hypothetical protein
MMLVTDFDLITVLSARTQHFHEDLQAERYKSSLEVVEVPQCLSLVKLWGAHIVLLFQQDCNDELRKTLTGAS